MTQGQTVTRPVGLGAPADPAALVLDVGLLSPVRAGTAVAEATGDRAWLQAMLDAEVGLTRAQQRLGLVSARAAEIIAATARADRFDLLGLACRARGAANPVVCLVQDLTAAVALADGDAADYVHRGSTSQDILDTAAMLVAARALRLVLADLGRTAAALARLAERYRDTPMAGRTLTQHAVPMTFGLKAAGWLQATLDAREHVRQILETGLPVQLGGAAGTLAGYLEYALLQRDGAAGVPCGERNPDVAGYADELIAAFADELGLNEPVLPWHTLRTPIARLAAALAMTTGALGKFAVDVQSLSRTEVAEVAEPAAAGRGVSSAMPHKRNPALATLIRSAAVQVPMLSASVTACMLAEDERPAGAWHAEWQPLRECLRLTGGAAHTAAELAEGIMAFPERMRANLDLTGGLIVSERIAAVLTPMLGKAAATAVLSRASGEAGAAGRHLADVLAGYPELTGRLPAPELAALLDPAAYLGASGQLVDRALRRYRHG
jgi:3-carboxy-cis,cis-muconate cycloisomerase